MFGQIARFLRGAESLKFVISRDGAGSLRILLQPVLSAEEPGGLDDDAKQLRAALAKPLLVTVPEAQIDTVLSELLARGASARDSIASLFESYVDDMAAQAAEAKRKAEEKAKEKAAKAETPKPSEKAKGKTGTPKLPTGKSTSDDGGDDDTSIVNDATAADPAPLAEAPAPAVESQVNLFAE